MVSLESHLGEELFFELVRERHFAGGDLVIGGSDEAELAAGEGITFRDADGRAEDAAGHWAEGVDVAETGLGIEGGAGCVIGEVFEAGVVLFGCSEDSSVEVAGEIWGVLGDHVRARSRIAWAVLRVGDAEGLHAGLKAGGVEGVDGECAVTALGAAGRQANQCRRGGRASANAASMICKSSPSRICTSSASRAGSGILKGYPRAYAHV